MKVDFSKDEEALRYILGHFCCAVKTCIVCNHSHRLLSESALTLKYLRGKISRACTPFCSFTCRNVWLVAKKLMPISHVNLDNWYFREVNEAATEVFWQVHNRSRVALLKNVWDELTQHCDCDVKRVLAYGEFYWFWRIINYKDVFYLATMIADEADLQDDKRRFFYAYEPIRGCNVWEVRADAPILV